MLPGQCFSELEAPAFSKAAAILRRAAGLRHAVAEGSAKSCKGQQNRTVKAVKHTMLTQRAVRIAVTAGCAAGGAAALCDAPGTDDGKRRAVPQEQQPPPPTPSPLARSPIKYYA